MMPDNTFPPQGHFQNVKTDTVQLTLDKIIEITEGLVAWGQDTLQFGRPGGEVVIQSAEEQQLPKVKNESGVEIVNGRYVRITGGSGSNPHIGLADPDSITTVGAIGATTEDIDNNQFGYVTSGGLVRGTTSQPIDTSSYPEGTILFLTDDGAFTNIRPIPPIFTVFVGTVIRRHASEGEIFVTIVAVPRLAGLSDVFVSGTPNDGDRVAYVAANNRFELVAGP